MRVRLLYTSGLIPTGVSCRVAIYPLGYLFTSLIKGLPP